LSRSICLISRLAGPKNGPVPQLAVGFPGLVQMLLGEEAFAAVVVTLAAEEAVLIPQRKGFLLVGVVPLEQFPAVHGDSQPTTPAPIARRAQSGGTVNSYPMQTLVTSGSTKES